MKKKNTISKRIFSTPLLLAVMFISPNSYANGFPVPAGLEQLIDEGQKTNQELAAIEDTVTALESQAPAVGTWDDPRIGIGISNLPTDSFSFNQEPMTQKQIALSQKIPWFGKLDLKSQNITLRALGLKASLKAKRLNLTRKISDRYYTLAFVDSSLRTNKQLTDMVSQLLKVSETRYAAGKGLQQDVLQAQVELSKLLDEKLTLLNQRKVVESKINELINRPNFLPVAPVVDSKVPSVDLNDDFLQKVALANNPWIKVRRIGIEQSDVGIELAEKDYYPNFDFKLAYGQREEDQLGRDRADFVSGFVSMSVPLWAAKKQGNNLTATKKKKEAAQKAVQGLVDTIPHQVKSLAAELRTLWKNYQLYREGLIIQAEQWARSSLAAYEVGKVEFNTMINSQIRLARLQLKAEKYRFSIFQKYAELEQVLGGPMYGENTENHLQTDKG